MPRARCLSVSAPQPRERCASVPGLPHSSLTIRPFTQSLSRKTEESYTLGAISGQTCDPACGISCEAAPPPKTAIPVQNVYRVFGRPQDSSPHEESAAESPKAEYHLGPWRHRLLSQPWLANAEIPTGDVRLGPLPRSLSNSNCGSG